MRNCYSWEGEDILADKIFKDVMGIHQGFYLDIGAKHPFDLSNTALLYENGWRGINVDAMPGAMALFEQYRPEDKNIEAGISENPAPLTYSMFNHTGLNGFLPQKQIEQHIRGGAELLGQKEIVATTINDVIDNNADGREIDLLTIDAEGLDYTILKSLDDRHRPKMIITETFGRDVADILRSPVYELMQSRD